jgi:hypothetical protein
MIHDELSALHFPCTDGTLGQIKTNETVQQSNPLEIIELMSVTG